MQYCKKSRHLTGASSAGQSKRLRRWPPSSAVAETCLTIRDGRPVPWIPEQISFAKFENAALKQVSVVKLGADALCAVSEFFTRGGAPQGRRRDHRSAGGQPPWSGQLFYTQAKLIGLGLIRGICCPVTYHVGTASGKEFTSGVGRALPGSPPPHLSRNLVSIPNWTFC